MCLLDATLGRILFVSKLLVSNRRLKLAVGATLESGIHFKKLPSLWNQVS
jgi:hypothetical protein